MNTHPKNAAPASEERFGEVPVRADTPLPKSGFIRVGKHNPRYVEAVLVGGPYEFKHTVKLLVGNNVIITEATAFLTSKPKSAFALKRGSNRAKKLKTKNAFVKKVLDALQTRPMTLKDLHQATCEWYGPLWQRLANWPDLAHVRYKPDTEEYYL